MALSFNPIFWFIPPTDILEHSCMKNLPILIVLHVLLLSGWSAPKIFKGTWTSPDAKGIPGDFSYQGEFASDALGAHVIALSKGAFQAVIYAGGLPGDGWNGEHRVLLDGQLQGDKVVFNPPKTNKKYLGKTAAEFSATKRFPPLGHKPCTGTLEKNVLTVEMPGAKAVLKKLTRKSATMGAKPPAGAQLLFDGSSKDAFQGGRLDEATRLLNTDGSDIRTKQKYNNYTMHVEFMLPFRPDARGQGRGNSGFYQVEHYEVQILDSFGLEGENNECGGIYKNARPSVNMCFPPLSWQTYDVEFTNAVFKDGKKVSKARITLRHNGVLIHDNVEVKGPTGGHRKSPEGTPGPIKFQGHGNPLQFRNIWILEK